MIPWPFLFCQKPIVRAPVFAGTRQTFAVTEELPVSSTSLSRSCTVKVAVLLTVTQSCGTVTVRWYVNDFGFGSPTQTVPSVPAWLSVASTQLWITVVGSPKVKVAVAGNDESGVTEPSPRVGSHETVAVFVPFPGFDENVQSYGYSAVSPPFSVPPAGSRLLFTSGCPVAGP